MHADNTSVDFARLGAALRLARRKQRITLPQMAERIGSSARTLQRIEAGDPRISVRAVATYLEVLGVNRQLTDIAVAAISALPEQLLSQGPEGGDEAKDRSEDGAG